MNLMNLTNRAIEIRQLYDKVNATRGVTWNDQDLMSGFVGDVGDLSKLIMAKNGLREIENVDDKLAHELADCLWSILVIADKCDINLDIEFSKTMDDLELRLSKKK